MAAPLQLSVCQRIISMPIVKVNSRICDIIFREYRSQQKKIKPGRILKDPRQNAQYPYTPGDPLHDDINNEHGRGRGGVITSPTSKTKSFNKTKGFANNNYNMLGNPKDKRMKDNMKHRSQFGHIYDKLNDGDLRLGRTILKAKSSKEMETILLEGQRLIKDAISLGAQLKYLYFSAEETLKDLNPSMLRDAQIFKIPYKDMKTWSDTTTPSGIMGVFKKPGQGESFPCEEPRLPLTLILDGVKDPGNIGTLIRTAAAVSCQRILVLKGCANVWEGKVLRSGMGSHFAVPIYSGLTWSQVYGYMDHDTRVFLADARAENDIVPALDTAVSTDERHNAWTSESDSDVDGEDSGVSSSDSDLEVLPVPGSASTDMNASTVQTPTLKNMHSHVSFPIISYSNMIIHPPFSLSEKGDCDNDSDSDSDSVALVISNETQGLSPSAKKFAYHCYGTFVTVPMNPMVDSLNTAVAGSIILYELRRKMLDSIVPSSDR